LAAYLPRHHVILLKLKSPVIPHTCKKDAVCANLSHARTFRYEIGGRFTAYRLVGLAADGAAFGS